MAGSAILERELSKRSESASSARSAEELEHAARISANYRKLLFEDSDQWADSVARENAALRLQSLDSAIEEHIPSPAERIADYMPVSAPARPGRKNLFEGLTYKQGTLIEDRPAPSAPQQAATITAPAPAAPVQTSEEDALPTRRTMETLRESVMTIPAERTVAVTGAGFLAALSVKTKVVLCAVAAAILLFITLICVNTGIINGLNSDISALRIQESSRAATYHELNEQITDMLTNPENELIQEWAAENGYVLEP